jgi:hypothetical protein
LATLQLAYRINGGAEQLVTFPASGPAGGQARTQSFTVAASSGTLTGELWAVDTSGNPGLRVTVPPFTFGTKPLPAGGGTLTITK